MFIDVADMRLTGIKLEFGLFNNSSTLKLGGIGKNGRAISSRRENQRCSLFVLYGGARRRGKTKGYQWSASERWARYLLRYRENET